MPQATEAVAKATTERATIAQTRVAWVPHNTLTFKETDTLMVGVKSISAASGLAVKSGQLGFLQMKFIL